MHQFGSCLRHETSDNICNGCNQLRQKAQNHPDGQGPGGRVEIRLLGAQCDKTIEDANANEDKRKCDRPKEL